ncbi:hypothetical protein AAKU55_003047 [Oxalobacteraceae bacterium GrIS 1.11]
MNSHPNPEAGMQALSDVFDMEDSAQAPAALKEVAPPEARPPVASAISKVLKRVRPLHFELAAAVAAIVWVVWPYVFPGDAASARPASRLMLPATAEAPPRVPAPDPVADAAPQPAAIPPDLPPFAQAAPSEPPTRPIPPRPSREAAHAARTALKRSQAAIPAVGAASARFSLNTVYAGQAWIQDDERTYVVQAGDKVKGVDIVSIDARQRRVLTSQGVIR